MRTQQALKPTQEIYQNLDMLELRNVHSIIEDLSKQLTEEEKEEILKKSIRDVKNLAQNAQIYNDEFFYTALLERLEFINHNLDNMKRTITIKVVLKNLEDRVYRVIQMPFDMTVADMTYNILASFKANVRKEFIMNIDGKQYNSDHCDKGLIEDYASMISLKEVGLNQGSQIVLHYDLDEEYIFDIYIKEIKECKHLVALEDVHILSGRGYGIFEEGHELLQHYYLNCQEFLKQIKRLGLDQQDFFLEEFDYKADYSNIPALSQQLRILYESIS